MSLLRLTLLGEFSARDGSGREIAVSAKKSRALLAVLALSPSGSATRERLANLLWSDRGDEQARSSLRQALAVLKKELSWIDAGVLSSEGDRIGLDGTLVSSDVAELQRLARTESIEELRHAAALYRGDLLADTVIRDPAFDDWLAAERRQLADMAIAIFERLVTNETGKARIAAAQRLVALDHLKETSHRALMEAYALAGEKAQALQQYAACRDRLQTELGVPPGPETEKLRRAIAEGKLGAAAAPPASKSSRASIAVLPFTNMSGDPEQDYFADGLTEDLITALAKSRHLAVLSRNATFQYKGRAVDVKAAERELGADYILEGSVRKGGSRLRVTAQLIDCARGAHLWAERFDRDLADVFAVQDEIVTAITAQLTYDLIDLAAARTSAPTASLTAYDLLLRSRSAWRRGAVIETFDLAKQAVALDPEYASALGFLSFIYAEDTWMQMSGMPVDKMAELSQQLAARALAANEGDVYVHHIVGTAHLTLGDLERGRLHLERALQLNPHFTSTVINLGLCIFCQGDYQDGLTRIAHGLRLEPRLAPAMRAVPFYAHCFLGDCDAAKADLLHIEDPLAFMSLLMSACLAGASRHDEAKRYLADFEAHKPAGYDVPGLVRWASKLCREPDMRRRFVDGFRKLGFAV